MLKRILFFAFIVLVFASCDNKVDLNDEYQEVTIVYGLLNTKDTRHFVKITKAFQSEGSVYIASQDPKNSEFAVPREVYMDEYVDNFYTRTISLDTFTIANKDTGVFYYPTQVVYATAPNVILVEGATYKLVIKNKTTGAKMEAQTTTIQQLNLTKPSPGATLVGLTMATQVDWMTAPQGKLYQFTLRFFYHNDSLGTCTPHSCDQKFSSVRSKKTEGGELMSISIPGNSFFENLSRYISAPNLNVVRYVDSIQYIFDVANEDFTVYMDVNKPSSSLVQERPAFSNISNGIGIFASRSNKIKKFVGLNAKSMDSLVLGSYTSHLGFVK